jgi:hypothetical protein
LKGYESASLFRLTKTRFRLDHIAPDFLARFSARFSFRLFWAGFFFSLLRRCSLFAMAVSLSADQAFVTQVFCSAPA